MTTYRRVLSEEERVELLKILKTRFEKNMNRHKGLDWENLQAKLESNNEKLWPLYEMEITDGEPDVVGYDNATNEYIFYDCSAETPKSCLSSQRYNFLKANHNLGIVESLPSRSAR